MLTETGKVLAVEDANVWVETVKSSTCGQCRARHGCGQRLLAATDDYTRVRVGLSAEYGNLQAGDEVTLGIAENAFLRGVFIAYGLPLSTMLLGLLTASLVTVREGWLIAAAVAGLCAGGIVVRVFAQSLVADKCFRARLISRAEKAIVQSLNGLD